MKTNSEIEVKRVGILTLPLDQGNYGGALQAFALQKVVKSLGYDVVTHKVSTQDQVLRKKLSYLKRGLLKATLHKNAEIVKTPKVMRILLEDIQPFLDENIKTEDLLKANHSLYKGMIVGSDQVWRSAYTNVLQNLFDFVEDVEVTKISYAASFGLDDLSEYDGDLIKGSANLASKLSGISVREDSGVQIVQRYWGLSATQHIDPTMLLNAGDYHQLITNDNSVPMDGKVFVYVLDQSGDKHEIINKCAELLRLKVFELMPMKAKSRRDFFKNKELYKLPSIQQWIRGFSESEYVITDSFHGCAFSIIFNKPFIAIGNNGRGLARFTSLLKKFGLEDRLIMSSTDLSAEVVNKKINWDAVNAVRRREQRESLSYLEEHLG